MEKYPNNTQANICGSHFSLTHVKTLSQVKDLDLQKKKKKKLLVVNLQEVWDNAGENVSLNI